MAGGEPAPARGSGQPTGRGSTPGPTARSGLPPPRPPAPTTGDGGATRVPGLARLGRRLADLVAGSRCPACGREGPAPCARCRAGLAPLGPQPAPAGLDSCVAAFAYRGPGRELVARTKYRGARAAVPWMAAALATRVAAAPPPGRDPGPGGAGPPVPVRPPGPDRPGPPGAVDVVTWVPTTTARRRRRGFDQAELLARAVASHLGRPCHPLLRNHGTTAQTGRAAADRRQGPRLAARGPVPRAVLVVDDVLTTGASLGAAAAALRRAGAAEVHGAVVARTPPPGERSAHARPGPGRPPTGAGGPGRREPGGGVESTMVVCRSVVASRGQSQAKRPT